MSMGLALAKTVHRRPDQKRHIPIALARSSACLVGPFTEGFLTPAASPAQPLHAHLSAPSCALPCSAGTITRSSSSQTGSEFFFQTGRLTGTVIQLCDIGRCQQGALLDRANAFCANPSPHGSFG